MKRKLYVMYCEDEGEYELWFNEEKKCIGGYYCNDAMWRSEYFNGIFRKVDIEITTMKYDEELAEKSRKKLFGF